MLTRLRLPLAIIAVLLLSAAIARPDSKKKNDKEAEKDKGKPFETVIKDYQKIEGLFTFYSKPDEGKVYMEIKPDQFGVEYLCNMTRSAGDGTYYDNGADRGDFPLFFKLFCIKDRVKKKLLDNSECIVGIFGEKRTLEGELRFTGDESETQCKQVNQFIDGVCRKFFRAAAAYHGREQRGEPLLPLRVGE